MSAKLLEIISQSLLTLLGELLHNGPNPNRTVNHITRMLGTFNQGSYYSLQGGGGLFFIGGPESFGVVKGGTIFFSVSKGGPEKIGDRLSQTDGPPPGKKNDSSPINAHGDS